MNLQSKYPQRRSPIHRAMFVHRAASCTPTGVRPKAFRVYLEIVLCALALTALMPASAEGLGRLFFTPEQRAQLDYTFSRVTRSDNNDRGGVLLNGIVQKQGGKRTAWINGVPQIVGISDEKSPESMPLTIPGQTKPIKVKVGQRVMVNPSASTDTTKPDSPKQDAPKQ